MEINKASQAVACFRNDFNCAQSVFSTFAEQHGLDKQVALKISGAFGGGMARMADTCGAVTGALMVIGLKHGKCRAGDDDAKTKTNDLAREFVDRFKAIHYTIVCRELLGCDIGTELGKQVFHDRNYGETRCEKFVGDAATILEEIL